MFDNLKSWLFVRRLKKAADRKDMIQRKRTEIIIMLEVKWQLEQDVAREQLQKMQAPPTN